MSELRFCELPAGEIVKWDSLIVQFPESTIFHSHAWLNYLSESRNLDVKFWTLLRGADRVGYLCGGVLQKGPFRIFGSPLKGWGTNVMGPLLVADLSDSDVMDALDQLAATSRFSMTEIECRGMDSTEFERRGYQSENWTTYLVALNSSDPDEMLKSMTKARRYGIRKAVKGGLSVEDASDVSFADEFYDQFIGVMARQGGVPGYSREYPRLLFRHLKNDGRLLALRVRSPRGHVIATGFFPYDTRTIFYWGGASTAEGRRLFANDFMHWQAMCLAAERGITTYDMSGYGKFKKEFGGTLVTLKRWHKCYSYSANIARRGYGFYVKGSLRLQSWISSVRGRAQALDTARETEEVAGRSGA